MLLFEYGRWDQVRREADVWGRSIEDVAAVCRAIMAVMLQTEAKNVAQVRGGGGGTRTKTMSEVNLLQSATCITLILLGGGGHT